MLKETLRCWEHLHEFLFVTNKRHEILKKNKKNQTQTNQKTKLRAQHPKKKSGTPTPIMMPFVSNHMAF